MILKRDNESLEDNIVIYIITKPRCMKSHAKDCLVYDCSYTHLKWDQRKYYLIRTREISTICFSLFMHSTHQNHSALFQSMFLKRLYLPSYINKDLVSRIFLMSECAVHFSHIRFSIFKIRMYPKGVCAELHAV